MSSWRHPDSSLEFLCDAILNFVRNLLLAHKSCVEEWGDTHMDGLIREAFSIETVCSFVCFVAQLPALN
jgi:hypothetical protein